MSLYPGFHYLLCPPAPVLVALAEPVVLVAFVPCAKVSEGTIPTNDIVKRTDIMLAPRTEIISYCFNAIKKYVNYVFNTTFLILW
jgi:hypothetical protein